MGSIVLWANILVEGMLYMKFSLSTTLPAFRSITLFRVSSSYSNSNSILRAASLKAVISLGQGLGGSVALQAVKRKMTSELETLIFPIFLYSSSNHRASNAGEFRQRDHSIK